MGRFLIFAFISIVGSRLALKKGSSFVRIFFVVVVTGVILQFGYDIFK